MQRRPEVLVVSAVLPLMKPVERPHKGVASEVLHPVLHPAWQWAELPLGPA